MVCCSLRHLHEQVVFSRPGPGHSRLQHVPVAVELVAPLQVAVTSGLSRTPEDGVQVPVILLGGGDDPGELLEATVAVGRARPSNLPGRALHELVDVGICEDHTPGGRPAISPLSRPGSCPPSPVSPSTRDSDAMVASELAFCRSPQNPPVISTSSMPSGFRLPEFRERPAARRNRISKDVVLPARARAGTRADHQGVVDREQGLPPAPPDDGAEPPGRPRT